MTSPTSKSLTFSQRPWFHRLAWGCALPVALLVTGWAYLKVAHSQSNQPYLDQPVGWISRLVLSNNDLSSGPEVVFRPEFNKTTGQGSLFANHINASGEVLASSPWANPDAGVLLKSQDPFTNRRIFTRNDTTNTGVPFVWNELSSAQKAALGNATSGPMILGFLRGQTLNEGNAPGQFRIRQTPLGAIVHSNLVRWTHSPGKQRLFVGANDGMVHAFDAATGEELFAYVPSMLIPRLAGLAQPGYIAQAFVDGPQVIANVQNNGTVKTLLVGGLGGGGKGLFSLDVSASTFDSDAAAAQTLKWEISPSSIGFSNLGYTYAAPSLVRLQDDRHAVVVGNGYGSNSGKATLLLIDALTGALIREIATGVGSAASPNGLSSPTLADRSGDGKADTAYAGDLQGNLWRFDLSGSTAPKKLFTTSPAQAISTAPVLRRHPAGGQLVVFGTGKALIDDDLSDTSDHAVYGIWDDAPPANQALLEQSFSEVSYSSNNKVQRWRTTTKHPINWSNQATPPLHKGWKLSLPDGERLLGESPFIDGNRFVFTSMNPTTSGGAGYGPGENWLMQVSVFNGGMESPIFDVNGDGKLSSSDNVSGKILNGRFIANGVLSQPVLTDSSGLSRTLFNYNPEITVTITPGETTNTTETYTPPPTPPSLGVSNGHFDVDIFYGTTNVHEHEYDDKYNVVGVNFLNPADTRYTLTKAISSSTPFKVLVVNQYLNPASLLRVGPGAAYVPVKDFQGQASAADSNFVVNLLEFKPSTVTNFVWKLPLDAFVAKDWWQDGGVKRAGLIPTQTGCVNKAPFSKTIRGKNGEIFNGALTLQLIKSSTPASALERNYETGGSKYGWRVKDDQRSSYVLAEYTMFWHADHESKDCYGEQSWKPDPGPDNKSKGGNPGDPRGDPTATSDPVVDGPVTEVSRVVTVSGNVTTTVITYSDNSKKTIRTTVTAGQSTESRQYRDGTTVPTTGVSGCNGTEGGATCLGPPQVAFLGGRFNWRELRSDN